MTTLTEANKGNEASSPSVQPSEIFNRITDAIACAEDAHVLLFIDRVKIPLAHVADEERVKLKQAVRERFCKLNQLAVGQSKGRWS